jgi:cobalt-precorrin-5B (C1)-methyltransferase
LAEEENGRAGLRYGWTTGTCATGAATAAFTALLGGGFPDPVEIRLPRGRVARLPLAEGRLEADRAVAGIVKDAGDDPDVTHGCLVRAAVRRGAEGSGVHFAAGEGVGTVTRPGLPIPPGEPAINPVPRRLIGEALARVAAAFGVAADAQVEIAIPGGRELAKRTLNGRLGILGGLSILGTTGIVVPFSCSAWIHSIYRGIDVARAMGIEHVAAATGSTSEHTAQALHGLPEVALLEMGDFVGATLKYLRRHPVPRLTLAGGFAKMTKLAQGALDLHSGRSRVNLASLGAELVKLGGRVAEVEGEPLTALAYLETAGRSGLPLGERIACLAREVALKETDGLLAVEVVVVDRAGGIVGRARGW